MYALVENLNTLNHVHFLHLVALLAHSKNRLSKPRRQNVLLCFWHCALNAQEKTSLLFPRLNNTLQLKRDEVWIWTQRRKDTNNWLVWIEQKPMWHLWFWTWRCLFLFFNTFFSFFFTMRCDRSPPPPSPKSTAVGMLNSVVILSLL